MTCPRCRRQSGRRDWIYAWIKSDHPYDYLRGVQQIPVTCCKICYIDIADSPGIVWSPDTIQTLKKSGKPIDRLKPLRPRAIGGIRVIRQWLSELFPYSTSRLIRLRRRPIWEGKGR